MFSVLVTDSFGASEAIQALYLMERRLDLALTSEPVFQARQRDTGQRLWLKCTDGTAESSARLVAEGRLLARLHHPHILGLAADHSAGAEPHLALAWCAQQPLTESTASALPPATRIRLALSLLETIHFLQTLAKPVAHCSLALENLWVTGNAGWLQLAGFGQAQAQALPPDLAQDRQQALELINQLTAGATAQNASPQLGSAGSEWAAQGQAAYSVFLQALGREFVGCVTSDL